MSTTRVGKQRRQTRLDELVDVEVVGVLVGYAWVCTTEQGLAHQVGALTRAGATETDVHPDTGLD